MSNVDFANVDKALARGDVIAPEVWNGIDSVMAGMSFFATKQAIPDTRLSSTMTPTANAAPTQRDIGDVAIADVSAPDDSASVSADDDSETIATMTAEHVQPEHAAEETAAREHDTSATGWGREGVRPDSEVIERLLASYSVQRKAVWRWCVDNRSIITHDMPSARVAGKGAGVSYETARHVLSDFRFHYRLTPPARSA